MSGDQVQATKDVEWQEHTTGDTSPAQLPSRSKAGSRARPAAARALYPVWVEVLRCLTDVSHEGAEADILAITQHVHSILASLLRPVAHVTGAITLVVTLNLGLRRAFH